MKLIRSAIILFCSAFLLNACTKDKKTVPLLEIDKTAINASTEEGSASFEISSNVNWDISGIPEWLTVDPSSGTGNASVVLSYPANLKPEALTVTLILNGTGAPTQRIVFTQLGAEPMLLVDKTILTESPAGQQDEVTITSNVPWRLQMPPGSGWIVPSAVTGNAGVSKLTFTIAPHTRIDNREANIILESAGATVPSKTLKVTQAQPDIVVSSFTKKAKGGATVKIIGTGFSTALSENKLTINGHEATITNATATELEATVPVGAGTGKLVVKVGEKTFTTADDFEYQLVWTVSTVTPYGSVSTPYGPDAIALDEDGNMYVADRVSHQIKKITPLGAVSTLAGSIQGYQEGTGAGARFNDPAAIVVDKNKNIYVADRNNHRIRKIAPNGVTSLLAGNGTTGIMNQPSGLALDADGNVYVADNGNHRILKINPAGVVSTITGGTAGYADGDVSVASFTNPTAITRTLDGTLYVAEAGSRRVRKIETSGTVSSVVDGVTKNPFLRPASLLSDAAGKLYVADQNQHTIFQLNPNGTTTVVAGRTIAGYRDGEGTLAQFASPASITFGSLGDIYVADLNNRMIRKIILR